MREDMNEIGIRRDKIMGEQDVAKNRAIFIEAFEKRIANIKSGQLPLLTLTEFFSGNTEEDSIAPNQCDFGRPPISEIWARMRELEARPDVAWVRVVLHDDTGIYNGEFTIYGDMIAICTAATSKDIERTIDYGSLCSGGATSDPSFHETYKDCPAIPNGYHVLVLEWD